MTRRELASRLRAQLAAADRSGAGKPFPEPLRRAVVEYAAEAVADGGSMEAAARDLGVSAMSINRWSARSAKGAQLRRVEIVPDPGLATLTAATPAVLVHTRSGLRIEGLTLPALVALVRAVG